MKNKEICSDDIKESFIRKVLTNDIVMLVSIIVGVFSFISFVVMPVNDLNNKVDNNLASITKDINTINNNHLTHLQRYAEEIKELKLADSKLMEESNTRDENLDNEIKTINLDVQTKMIRILTILEK